MNNTLASIIAIFSLIIWCIGLYQDSLTKIIGSLGMLFFIALLDKEE